MAIWGAEKPFDVLYPGFNEGVKRAKWPYSSWRGGGAALSFKVLTQNSGIVLVHQRGIVDNFLRKKRILFARFPLSS